MMMMERHPMTSPSPALLGNSLTTQPFINTHILSYHQEEEEASEER
jgi:hypothetical protein